MDSYEKTRVLYKPVNIKVLFIGESPPPAADVQSSRQFYMYDRIRHDDRLFTNTMKAVFTEAADLSEADLETNKQQWLERFKQRGYYMIEALQQSEAHEVTKKERQEKINQSLPDLIERVKQLAGKDTKIILIKSNVFDVAAQPLKTAGFHVLNKALVDYPGHFNQRAYREKITQLLNF